jgi:hypothetical protein
MMDLSFERLDVQDNQAMNAWDSLVAQKTYPAFGTYCNSTWIRILSRSYGYEPFLYFIKNKDEVIGLVPIMKVNSLIFGNRFMSLPVTDHSCGPILFDAKKESYEEVYRFLIGVSKNERVDYIRLHNPPENSWNIIEKFGGVVPYSYYSFRVNLAIEREDFLNNLESRRRRDINKTINENKDFCSFFADEKEIDKGRTLEDIYRLHLENMKNLGTPPHNFSFIKNCFEESLRSKLIRTLLIKQGEKTVGYFTFLNSGNELRWAGGSYDTSMRDRSITTHAFWNYIKDFFGKKYIFDLGGSRGDSGNYFYKVGWLGKNNSNGELIELRHYHIFFKNKKATDPRNNFYKTMSEMWRRYLPSFFANSIGTRIRKDLGL